MAISTYTIPAEKIVHNTSVDFSSRFSIINPIHIVQYDNSLPIISVELKNNNKTYVLPTNIEVWIRWKKPDNTFVRKQALGCNSERNTVYFEISQQMVMQYGLFKPVVELVIPSDSSEPSIASSGYFSVLVDRNPIQNGDIKSMSEYVDPYKTVCYTKEQVDTALVKKADKSITDKIIEDLNRLNSGGLIIKDDVIKNDIDNWLNEHPEAITTVQDGTITEVKFADALKLKKASFYRNVAEMKADTSLKPGMTAVVLGYYEPNDGGSAEYYISNSGNITLNNGLKAQIVIKPQMSIECFGAKGDGKTDDSSAIEAASVYDTKLVFKNKTYFIASSISIKADSIYWLGNNTVFNLSDNFQMSDRTAIKISGATHIENISVDYKSNYECQGNESEAALLRVTDGKHHTLKNVNIRLTQADGKSACIDAVWYDFATSRAGGVEKFEGATDNTLTVENCRIENLTTGYKTGTSCLWGTGVFSSIILNNCEFTRNFSGDAVNFWANDHVIKNININNCVFNLTNNIYSGSSGLQFGASSAHPTSYEKINISNTVFNVGAGFGSACVGCPKPGTEINVNRCKFIKDYDATIIIPIPPDVTSDKENSYKTYYKRLVAFNVFSSDDNASCINLTDCEIKNKHSNLWIDILSEGSYKTQFRINGTSISAFANIYNPANMYCVNCSIAIDNDDKYVFYQSNAYSINTALQNCAVNAISKISGNVDFCNTDFSDTLEIKSSNGKNIIAENNNFKELNIVTTSESTVESPVISELIMKNNIISVLNLKNYSTVTAVDNLGTLASSVIFVNNISNKTMLDNVIK